MAPPKRIRLVCAAPVMDVLSFDCGLRNLAAAVVRILPTFAFPPECKAYASPVETADQFKERAMLYFVQHAWTLVHARLIDVSEYLGRDTRVKQVKKLSLMNKARGIHAVLESLEQQWFHESAADIVAVEIQHGANAEMRAVSLAIPVFFMRSMTSAEFVGVVGGQKLKVCDAVGVRLGDGTAHLLALKAEKKAAKAAARKGPVRKKKKPVPEVVVVVDSDDDSGDDCGNDSGGDGEDGEDAATAAAAYNPYAKGRFGRRGGSSGGPATARAKRDKYEDNKGRAMKAMAVLLQPRVCTDPALIEAVKDPNVADAILQGVWVLWTHVAPRAPARRKAKDAPPVAKKMKVL